MTRSQRLLFVAAEVARAPHAPTDELFRATQRAGFDQSQSEFYMLVSRVRGRAAAARGKPKPAPKVRHRRRHMARRAAARRVAMPAPAPRPPRFHEVSAEARARALDAAIARAHEVTLCPVVERVCVARAADE